jgi:TPR repeat protein
MKNLKKIINILKKCLPTLLCMILIIFPTCGSLYKGIGHKEVEKGESLAHQGNFTEAIKTLSPFALKNDPHALYLMAIIYLSQKSNHLHVQKGIAFLEKAVFQNYPPALDEMAGLYLVGEGVQKNEAKALQYYIQASHLGYGPSQFNCGVMYKNGQGTEKDFVKSYLYFALAALNYKDLEEVAENAAHYRDEVASFLSPAQRQGVSRQINSLVSFTKFTKKKGIAS